MAGMGSMTECSDPSAQNKMAVTGCLALRVGDDGKLYCLCEPGWKTLCARAVSRLIGDTNKRLSKMEGMEFMTECLAPILDPSVHHGMEDGKLCCFCKQGGKTTCKECAEAAQSHHKLKDEYNLMCSKIQTRSQLNKMAGMVEKLGKLYNMCKNCIVLADAQSHGKKRDENGLMCSKIQIQPHLNKLVVMESLPDWSGLLTDLLAEIAIKLSLIEDFTAFRGVCTSWRAAATMDKFVSVSKVPLLMLPEKDGDNDVVLCKNKIFTRLLVPEAEGKRCIGVGFGWILTVETSGSGELNLVKPMSSSKIKLPNMMTFPEYMMCQCDPKYNFIGRAAVSDNPSETLDFVLMVCVNMNVGFWRNGDAQWTKIVGMGDCGNICFYRRKVYAFDWQGRLWTWDPSLTPAPEILLKLDIRSLEYMDLVYLVESSKGELLLIVRSSAHRWPEGYSTRFKVMQIDTVNKSFKWLDSLDQDAIFTGQNCATVSANDFPGIVKANCIYFTDDDCDHYYHTQDGMTRLPGTDMGIYSVKDGSVERFEVVESLSYICPPFWIFHHFDNSTPQTLS